LLLLAGQWKPGEPGMVSTLSDSAPTVIGRCQAGEAAAEDGAGGFPALVRILQPEGLAA